MHRHERPHEPAQAHDPRVGDVERRCGGEHRRGEPALAEEHGREQALHREHAAAHGAREARVGLEQPPRGPVAVGQRPGHALERLAVAPRRAGELRPAGHGVGEHGLQRDAPQGGVDDPRVALPEARERRRALDEERHLVRAVGPVVVARVERERAAGQRGVGGEPGARRQRGEQRERRRHAHGVRRRSHAAVGEQAERLPEAAGARAERAAAHLPVVEAAGAPVARSREVLQAGDQMGDRRGPLHARQGGGAVRRGGRQDVARECRQGGHGASHMPRRATAWARLPPPGEHLHPDGLTRTAGLAAAPSVPLRDRSPKYPDRQREGVFRQ